jgi:hypothetical protein
VTFSGGIKRQTDALSRRLDQAARIAVLEMFNSVRDGSPVTGSQGTPVDTGFARNSWSLSTPDPRVGDVVTITGGAVYLRGLEEGRARQRPAGWVRLTIAQWPAVRAWALRQVGLAP